MLCSHAIKDKTSTGFIDECMPGEFSTDECMPCEMNMASKISPLGQHFTSTITPKRLN